MMASSPSSSSRFRARDGAALPRLSPLLCLLCLLAACGAEREAASRKDGPRGDGLSGKGRPGDARPGDARPGDQRPGDQRPGDQPPGAELLPCLAASSDWRPIAETNEFPASGRWLGAVFALGAGETGERLLHVWTAVDVGAAAPPEHEIARSALELRGARRGRLVYEQDVPLPEGRYRLDVFRDAQPWRSVELRVVADQPVLPIATARELFPLVEGAYWEYDFVSEAGSGPAAPVATRAGVRIEVGEDEAAGRHLRFLRDGELVHEEWWRAEEQGLVATRRRTRGAAATLLDPPQTLLPVVRQALTRWTYVARDGAFRQQCRCFGPRPVRGPEGLAPGYVVVVEQRDGGGDVSSERHFLPGFGLVREEIVHSRAGQRYRRELMTIRQQR